MHLKVQYHNIFILWQFVSYNNKNRILYIKPLGNILSFLLNIEENMDGQALIDAFETCSGPDCIKDIIPKYGIRVKTYKILRDLLHCVLDKQVCLPTYLQLSVLRNSIGC